MSCNELLGYCLNAIAFRNVSGRALVSMCRNTLQCVAVCCSVLQCVAVCCSVLQCVARIPLKSCVACGNASRCAVHE